MINLSDKPAEESDMNFKQLGLDLAAVLIGSFESNGRFKWTCCHPEI